MKSSRKKPSATRQRKKPYRPPKLVVYGDLRRLTTMMAPPAKGGAMADGMGLPKTRV
jgi:hypothetical protein